MVLGLDMRFWPEFEKSIFCGEIKASKSVVWGPSISAGGVHGQSREASVDIKVDVNIHVNIVVR